MSTDTKDKTLINMPPPEYPGGDKYPIPDYPPPAYSPGGAESSSVLKVENGQMELGSESAKILCQNCRYEVDNLQIYINIKITNIQ